MWRREGKRSRSGSLLPLLVPSPKIGRVREGVDAAMTVRVSGY
jgi:hypothetical protein